MGIQVTIHFTRKFMVIHQDIFVSISRTFSTIFFLPAIKCYKVKMVSVKHRIASSKSHRALGRKNFVWFQFNRIWSQFIACLQRFNQIDIRIVFLMFSWIKWLLYTPLVQVWYFVSVKFDCVSCCFDIILRYRIAWFLDGTHMAQYRYNKWFTLLKFSLKFLSVAVAFIQVRPSC